MRHYLLLPFMLLAGTPVAFSGTINESGDSVRTEASANPAVVTGTVIDESGEPVIGANISLKGSNDIIAVSDSNGLFSIPGLNGDETLKVEYLGYDDETIKLTNGEQSYRVVLKPDMSQLDEVVVVGYATQKKVDLTGAVSSISSNALSDRPLTNATSALAGLAAGLTVTNSGGNTPGYESQSILVRGQGTLNNAAPLVVVDGMTGIAISDINPQDIESISILKDAASAAIYGSRAANGVILVTTRQGAERAPRVTYSGNVSFETVAKRLNLVTDYADFMEIQNAGLIANGQAPRFSQGKIDEWRNDGGKNPTVYPNTDWQDHIYRNPSVVQNHNLSITGGSRRVRYNITLGYVNNPGMIYYTDYQRYQLRSNLEVKIKPWLSVGTNIFGYIDKNNPSSENAAAGGDVIFGSGAFNTVPGMTLYDPATGLYGGVQNPEEENVSNFNPYRRQWFYDTKYPTKTKRSVIKLNARLTPVKGLTIQGSFAYNYWERNIEHHLTDRNLYRFTLDGPVLLREGKVRTYIRRYNYKNTYRSSEVTANYDFSVSRLQASVLAGMSQEYNKYDTDFFIKYDLVDPSLGAIDAGTTNGNITGNYNEWAMRSYFGRINLNWDNRYLLEANLRADGSSKFAPDKRWGYFPSVSVGWRVSQEKFMEASAGWLDQLKLRASYGSLGNNATTSYYMYQSLFATANYILNGNITGGLAQTVLANPDLTWEKTYMTNIGLDFALFNSRLSGTIDLYNKNTKGILISLPAPLEHGTSTVPNQNAGEVNNKGFEVDLHWNDRIGKVSYNIGVNLGFVNNKVTKFQGDVASINDVYKTQEGKPINQLYVITVDRIVRDQADLDYVQSLVDKNPDYFATYQRPELGDFLFRDANGDGKLDTNDRVEIGHGTVPRLSYGANLGASWNNFDFSILFQGVGNHQVYYNNQAFRFVTVMGQSLIKDITDNAWTPENPYNSKYPILRNNANSKNNVASDAFVHNAAYLRCKNIQLGYTIPSDITKKFFVESLKVYASIDNLFTITKFLGLDPEVGANVGYPTVRQYSIGLNISF
ncbi:TonB-dependent receptor [Barnesiella sp. WM24]|uniref:SusC/RagA family TonB-linked outer membrane protein n=1 Tax=Barnesiella sp. WM24 TaxID=2558278 RepID=UPI0010721720|nr:TonB-dependent receptor [Barnesiella sp. WM24]TFU92523.1 TonB-dependent receptor [Barnesiella sp. WM24]